MKRIIIADDEPITRMNISAMLKNIGYDVIGEASDGFDAVELCRQHHPDIALLDVRMPVFDGLSAAETIHSENLADCIVLLTAFSDIEIIEQAKEAGVAGYLVKPVSEKLLLPTLEVSYAQCQKLHDTEQAAENATKKLAEQKTIHKAQMIIATRDHITEQEAYNALRTSAMNKRISIADLASTIAESSNQDKDIQKAKVFLMKQKHLSEANAFKYICALAEKEKISEASAARKLLVNAK